MTSFENLLESRDTVFTVEVTPPHGADPTEMLARVEKLVGVADAIDITYCPLAGLHMNPMAFAHLLKHRYPMQVIVNVTTRDKNTLAIQSDLLGAHALGIHNIVVLMGDRMSTGDFEGCPEVHEVKTLGLLNIINGLNRGLDSSGSPLLSPTDFFTGSVINPGSTAAHDAIMKRIESLVGSEVGFFLTQPVFTTEAPATFAEVLSGTTVPVILGILPIKSRKMADKINNDLPGVKIPGAMMARIERSDPAEVRRLGLEHALEIMGAFEGKVAGFHLMTAGDLAYAKQIIEAYKTTR